MRIRTLISSYGMSGRVFHGPLLSAHPEFELVGIVQRSGRSAALDFPGVSVFHGLDVALSELRPELVIVNTPPFVHEAEIHLALEKGCHVVVEKPFTTDLDKARVLLDEARKAGRILTTFQNRRWDSDFLTLKRLKMGGRLGNWVNFESHFDRYRPEVELGSWKEKPHPGAGLVWNLGPHLVDQALQLFGMPVWMNATIQKIRPGALVDDFFIIQLGYSGFIAELKASYMVPEPSLKYRIQGTLGSFEKHGMDVQEEQLKVRYPLSSAGYGLEPEKAKGKVFFPDGSKEWVENEKGNYGVYFDILSKAIRKEGNPPVLPHEMLEVIEVLTKAYQSSKEGRVLFFTHSAETE